MTTLKLNVSKQTLDDDEERDNDDDDRGVDDNWEEFFDPHETTIRYCC